MSTPSRRRLLRDYKRILLDPPGGIVAAPDKEDLMHWQAVIFGPDDTPWEGGTFKLHMKFPDDYPNRPPVVKFVTKLFHPNIYTDGAICLDILANQWSPIYDVAAILASIQSLLTDPNPNSPANVEAAKLYVENRREYDRKVSEVIEALWKLEEEEESEPDEEEEEEGPRKKKQKLEEKAETADASATPAVAQSASGNSSNSNSSVSSSTASSSSSSSSTAPASSAPSAPSASSSSAAAASAPPAAAAPDPAPL